MVAEARFSAESLINEIEEWVSVESPTYAPEAVATMEALATERVRRLGFSVELVPGSNGFSGCVVCRRSSGVERPGILIIGHLDTVHPVGTLAGALPLRRDESRIYGPGIYDMKAGIVMALAALKVLIEDDALHLAVTILLNGDEEVGSPVSRGLIEAEAAKHAWVLIPEPAFGPRGEVTTGRHAFYRYRITTTGRPAHSGWTNKEGRSALRVMAQLVEELESQSDFEHGPTFSVGVLNSGLWVNCVPMASAAEVLCVARTEDNTSEIHRVLNSLAGVRNGVSIEVQAGAVRPLWGYQEGTIALYERARAIADDLGFILPSGRHGGGSDGNFTGALGIATLDGLGAIGHGAHTHEEHIEISSLVPRTTMLARLIGGLSLDKDAFSGL